MRTIRMTPPAGPGNNPISINGRNYGDDGAGFADLPFADAVIAGANGWTAMGMIGVTAERPLPSDPDAVLHVGMKFIDTSLDSLIIYGHDGLWHDAITGAAV